jgi:hypothetical protein
MSDLATVLQKYYYINDETTFDLYLGDIYEGSSWRAKLEYKFLKELHCIKHKLSDENIRIAAKLSLKYISKQLKKAIDMANENAIKEGKEPTYRRMASGNEIVAKKISDTVEQRLHVLNLDLVREIAKQLGIIVSIKNKQEICQDISNKLTKPVKVTKQLHRGKWKPIPHNNYDYLVSMYYNNCSKSIKQSSQFTVLKICENIEGTLYNDLEDETVMHIAKILKIQNFETRPKSELSQSITKRLIQV